MSSQKEAISHKVSSQLLPKETTGAEMHSIIKPALKSCKHKTTEGDEIEQYICETCEKEFKRKERLERHERIHSGELPFICASCNKGFRSKDSLNSHLAVHTDKKLFRCDKCCRSFKTSHELRKHQRLTKIAMSKNEPNDHSPVKCKLCTYQITSKRAGRQHLFTHKKKARRPFVCSTCKESFSKLIQLGNHQRKVHEIIPEELYCYKCRKVFGDRPELEQHQQTQCLQPHVHQIHSYSKTLRRPYACYRCNKSFRRGSGLGRHLATHFEVDPYRCSSCKTEFEDRLSYDKHKCLNLEQSSTSAKPILVVKFLPQSTEPQAQLTPLETSLENNTYASTISHLAAESSTEEIIENQQQPEQTGIQDTQIFSEHVETMNTPNEEFNLQVPMHTLAAGNKPVIVVRFLNTVNAKHLAGDIELSEKQ